MKCFGVILKGDASPLSQSQLGERIPSCLGMDGGFRGPFTYDELVSGKNVTISAGKYTIAIVGFNNVASCGSSISDLFNATIAADTYSIGESASFSFPSTSEITVGSSSYVPASAVNRTAACAPQTTGCTGYTYCDTFNEPDGTTVASRPMDSGSFWAPLNLFSAGAITSKAVSLTSNDSSGVLYSFLTVAANREATVRAQVNLGNPLAASVGLVARFGNTNNFARGDLFFRALPATCRLRISETLGGISTFRTTRDIDIADCPLSTFSQMEFIASGDVYTLNYRGYTLNYTAGAQTLTSNRVGFSSSTSNTRIGSSQTARAFQAR